MGRAVRIASALLLLLCGAAPLLAQQQESRMEQIMRPSADLTYDLRKSGASMSGRTFKSGAAQVKEFSFAQKSLSKGFETREFGGTKGAWMGDIKFSTPEASTKGKYAIPNANRKAAVRTMPTREAPEARDTLAVRELHDARRPYLGKESKKLGSSIDAHEAANWRSGGGEGMAHTGTTVEKFSTLKPMTIDDIREVLNKNK
jgi:hypothetical protein